MTGYTRRDLSNTIADGNLIDPDVFDNEFDQIQDAFSATGHTHDGSTDEGAPITVVGPAQDLVVDAVSMVPKTTGVMSLGSLTKVFTNIYATTLNGIATSADKLQTVRNIILGGDASGSVGFDGTSDVTLAVSVTDDSHNHTLSTVTDAGTIASQDADNVLITGGVFTGQVNGTNLGTAATRNDDFFLKSGQANSSIPMGTVLSDNFDGITYDDGGNTFEFWADQDVAVDTPIFSIDRETGAQINGAEVWNAGNDGSGSGLDADLLDGLQATSFSRLNAQSFGWVWFLRSSTSPSVLMTQQSTGPICEWRQGSGDGSVQSRVDNDGAIRFFGGAGQVFLRDNAGTAVVEQLSPGGGFAFGCDDSTVLFNGEAGNQLKANVDLTTAAEEVYVVSDNSTKVYTGLQSGWSSGHEFIFNSNGQFEIPGILTLGDNCSVSGQVGPTTASGILRLDAGTVDLVWRNLTVTTGRPSLYSESANTDLGNPSDPWLNVYSQNSLTVTSDEKAKTDIRDFSDSEKKVAGALKGLLKTYVLRSEKDDRGEEAKVHAGVIAQEVEEAFSAEGLDAHDYGVVEGKDQDLLSVRYSELIIFILAGM